MEFQIFQNLPDEKILEICETLDDISLARFVQTSEKNYDICNKVITQRTKLYNDYIDSLILDLQQNWVNKDRIKLNTTDKNREIELIYFVDREIYFIGENLPSPKFAITELGYTTKHNILRRSTRGLNSKEAKTALFELLRHRYITI